ncbi:hypothetical protein GGI15_004380 [Coemansia interrupta]|uniref:Protein PNS1 n=1 Tax=Coemansia interrupta TaxID=1126814 RepID=A0A9W8H7J8_9FUNG|nr:hypothetical protein GGI15_004380 [Coemansia interrupta]
MSFRNPQFRQACLAWISILSGETVAQVDDLVDAQILIEVTTQADPEYFATASLVLTSRPGEPNLDGLAQLARLLLRYFENELGKEVVRDNVPGVSSLCTPPFDDFWRLLVLVVSVTLLSEKNNASELYDKLDGSVQDELKRGMNIVWGDANPAAHHLVEMEGSLASGMSEYPQQFHSAYSSLGATVTTQVSQHDSPSRSLRISSPQAYEPATLHVSEMREDTEDASIGSIASADVYQDEYGDDSSLERAGSLVGFERGRADDEESDAESLASSYVSEFSQELLQYGSLDSFGGFSGPNSFFAYLFLANTLAYMLAGIYLLFSTHVPERKSPYFRDFYDLTRAIMQITGASLAAVLLSTLWMHLMRYQTRKVIWLTTLGIPVVSSATAIWAATQILRIPGAEGLVGYRVRNAVVILISLILAVRFIWSIGRRRRDIEGSVRVVSMTCSVLAQNRELYGFSILLLAFYAAYAALSAIFASRLPLVHLGLMHSSKHWPLAAYFALSFAWTSAVFWYFHRYDPGEPLALQTLQAAFVSAITRQFGTVVLSASFLFIAKGLHLIELVLRWLIGLIRVIPMSLVAMVIGSNPVHLADGWSSYTAVYAAFTGKGFFQASRVVTKLLRKHGLMHSPVVSLIRSSMTCYALLMSLLFGYALGLHAVHLLSLHSAMVAVLGSIIPFALLQLVTHVLSCAVEALVVCYAVDLELDSCHSVDVAQAMSIGGVV